MCSKVEFHDRGSEVSASEICEVVNIAVVILFGMWSLSDKALEFDMQEPEVGHSTRSILVAMMARVSE